MRDLQAYNTGTSFHTVINQVIKHVDVEPIALV
jgi:hypothetical protein